MSHENGTVATKREESQGRRQTYNARSEPGGMREFTEADEGIPVVDINDNPVGVVTAVNDGTAYIELDPGLVDAITSSLGLGDGGEGDAYALREEMVDRVTDDKVRLRGDHVGEQ